MVLTMWQRMSTDMVAFYESGEIVKSDEVEDMGWVKLDEALSVMQEDIVGKKVVEKILKYLKNN